MSNRIEQFGDHFSKVVEDVEKFLFFVRGREFQEQGLSKLEELLAECTALKVKAVAERSEDEANAFLAFECMARASAAHMRSLLALKDDKPGQAWDHLIDAQSWAADALRAHGVGSHLEGYIRHLHLLEEVVFPRPLFTSTGWVARSCECSICGAEYGDCDHIAGRAYMGEICAIVVKDADLKEVSIVKDPADKHCRAYTFETGGVKRDAFTHRVVIGDGQEGASPGEE